MKKVCSLLAAALLGLSVPGFSQATEKAEQPLVSVIHEGVERSESVCPYQGGLFISNFGLEGKTRAGIIYRKDGVNKTIVPPDGSLAMPTGMAVKDGYLFVCDRTRLVVYNLSDLGDVQEVPLEADDKAVNALALAGNTLYISVTDTGRIYTLDVSNSAKISKQRPVKWLDIEGPNGMAAGKGVLYITTIPPDYKTVKPWHIVYRVADLSRPRAGKYLDVPGLYDGAALSDDGKTLFLSDWQTGAVTAVDVAAKKQRVIYQEKGIGPADIAQAEGILFIPDLPHSRIIEINMERIQKR